LVIFKFDQTLESVLKIGFILSLASSYFSLFFNPVRVEGLFSGPTSSNIHMEESLNKSFSVFRDIFELLIRGLTSSDFIINIIHILGVGSCERKSTREKGVSQNTN
jgi:hypothetical protein